MLPLALLVVPIDTDIDIFRGDKEQQNSDNLQLHNDRTTLLLTNLQPKWASLPVAIYSICTPDNGWDCLPKHVE